MEARKNIFEKYPVITLIIILLPIIFFIDVLTGRFLIPKDYHSFRTKHYYYHHGVLPNQASYTLWTVEFYKFFSNSLALRDNAVKKIQLKKGNRKRILIMGDSHTEGVGVNFEQTFTGVCRTLVDSTKVEILNGACVSYSPKIEYLKTKYLIEKEGLEVDEIFLFVDISDLQNELVYENFEPQDFNVFNDVSYKMHTWFRRHSFIYYSVVNIAEKRERARFFRNAAIFDKEKNNISSDNHTAAEQLYSTFFSNFDDKTLLSNPQFHGVGDWMYSKEFKPLALKGLKLEQENILKLIALCKKHNIKLTVSVHPWYAQICKKNLTDEYTDSYMNFAKANNIGFINFYPLFITEENPYMTVSKYYIEGDNHWNAEGHKRVAHKLIEYIHY